MPMYMTTTMSMAMSEKHLDTHIFTIRGCDSRINFMQGDALTAPFSPKPRQYQNLDRQARPLRDDRKRGAPSPLGRTGLLAAAAGILAAILKDAIQAYPRASCPLSTMLTTATT